MRMEPDLYMGNRSHYPYLELEKLNPDHSQDMYNFELAYRLGLHIYLHYALPYDHFTLTLGMNPLRHVM